MIVDELSSVKFGCVSNKNIRIRGLKTLTNTYLHNMDETWGKNHWLGFVHEDILLYRICTEAHPICMHMRPITVYLHAWYSNLCT